MAQRPDGKGAGIERVAFTRPAADRIAKVVRKVEAGNRDGEPLTFGRVSVPSAPASLRRCEWTANWSTGETTLITFVAFTQATATAGNVFCGVYPGNGWVAKDGTSGWKLVSVDLTSQGQYDGEEIQMLGHNANGYMQWYNVTTCSTATAA